MLLDIFGNSVSDDTNDEIGKNNSGFGQRAIELLGQPIFLQQEGYTCGPAVVRMLFYLYFGELLREDDLAKRLQTNHREGTRCESFSLLSTMGSVAVTMYDDATFGNIRSILDKGRIPIVRYFLPKSRVDHYALIIRMDAETLYCIEPFFGGISSISRERFDRIWHTDPQLGPEKRILIDIIPELTPGVEGEGKLLQLV